jgi:hypothetical protein
MSSREGKSPLLTVRGGMSTAEGASTAFVGEPVMLRPTATIAPFALVGVYDAWKLRTSAATPDTIALDTEVPDMRV